MARRRERANRCSIGGRALWANTPAGGRAGSRTTRGDLHAADATLAAAAATKTVSIVAIDLESDPVATGLVDNLARPGRNVTGLFLDLPELAGKWLELLKEIVPQLAIVGVLGTERINKAQFAAVQAAAGDFEPQATSDEYGRGACTGRCVGDRCEAAGPRSCGAAFAVGFREQRSHCVFGASRRCECRANVPTMA
jgi:hypothetical protein